ncbi:MAG: hypothetical protein LBI03_03175 [Clostridiales bacterium]|nr:hypothetical protein [Clostridiales bacterium]
MSEPIKKPIQTPESYKPQAPKLMDMLEKHTVTLNDIISELSSGGEPPMLTGIRELFDGMKGHNYDLPDCLKFIFERIGAYDDINFWDIAALSGDTVAQVYNRNKTTNCSYSVSGYIAGREHIDYMFNVLGYGYEYITDKQFNNDKALYLCKIIDYINNGVPVLVKTNLNDIPAWNSDVGTYCLIVGVSYENEKIVLKLLVGGTVPINYELTDNDRMDLVFIGKKQRNVSLEDIYLQTIKRMAYWLTLPEQNGMYFGAAAYRAWADDIDNRRFADENLPLWENYGVYVCNLATSGGEPTFIFSKLAQINPQYMKWVPLGEKIQSLLPAETPTGGRSLLWIKLDELGGGMEATRETMRNPEKCSKIAAALRDYATRLDKVVTLLKEADL